jgi:hypothetical protein
VFHKPAPANEFADVYKKSETVRKRRLGYWHACYAKHVNVAEKVKLLFRLFTERAHKTSLTGYTGREAGGLLTDIAKSHADSAQPKHSSAVDKTVT